MTDSIELSLAKLPQASKITYISSLNLDDVTPHPSSMTLCHQPLTKTSYTPLHLSGNNSNNRYRNKSFIFSLERTAVGIFPKERASNFNDTFTGGKSMTLVYRGIKHNAVSSSKRTQEGNILEKYRGVVLWNRVCKG
jgi:hypothetical protein